MPLLLPRLRLDVPLVNADGYPSQTFQQWWDTVAKKIENSFNDLSAIVAAIAAAQASADAAAAAAAAAAADAATAQTDATAAAADAATAQADATAAAREAARINSYPNPGSIVTASDVGADCDIIIANHTRVYPVQGSIDVPDVSITGDTLHGLSFSTKYYIYYDDTALTDTTPTFIATTNSATAQVGAAAGRHFVGYVTTPADGGSSTSGEGGGTPGGGGGGGSFGGAIP